MSVVVMLREMVLATATGAVAGGAGTYFVLHNVWSRARAQGDVANGFAEELQRMRGVRAPAPSTVRAHARRRASHALRPPRATVCHENAYPRPRSRSSGRA